ncbi:MAG TPA: TIGR03013 family XrtA/PEP-CTERM system glycosyltransferase [Steroidobacteraceae bacterium]|jgi:sugar transferase (PEP-CTERM system associated)|nr:TIGR03013 family XrtA/PEP-CTERM system glycosyltransferase [Steroidobacteraceae bacterium]
MRIRVLGQYIHGSLAVLAVAELAMLSGALLAAHVLRFRLPVHAIEAQSGALWPIMLVFGCGMVISLFAFGLYSSRQRAPLFGIAVRLIAAVGVGTLGTELCLYVVADAGIGRGVLLIAVLLALAGLAASRYVFTHIVDEATFKRRVLVYGCGQRATAIASLRRRSDRRGFVVVGYLQPDGEDCEVPSGQLIASPSNLQLVCEQLNVDEVVVAMDDRRRAFPLLELLECRLAGTDVTELLTFLERETGRVRIDALNPSWMIFGEGFRRDPLRLFSSRMLDLIASLLILVVSLPVMVVTALAIKFEDGWRAPVLYRQARIGLGGHLFDVLKFRSMRTDAERDGRAQWAQTKDPRITRVGAIIRKIRVDELPQILNVLRGQMSFVGPRPERPQFVAQLAQNIPYYAQRHCVKPGITGWAQLCYPYGSSEQDALEKLQYDLYYIKNNTLLFDLAILVQTAEVVFMGRGAR